MGEFGAGLRQARERKGWTQKDLAERLEVHPNDVARWERGDRTPSDPARLVQMARALDTTVEALVGLAPAKPTEREAYQQGGRTAADLFIELAERLKKEGVPELDATKAPTKVWAPLINTAVPIQDGKPKSGKKREAG